MTPSAAPAGSVSSPPSGTDRPTSTSSPGTPTTPTRQPQPSLSPAGGAPDVKANGSTSLYALGIQAQDIDGEIALAAELLATDNPDEEASAIALIEQYLAAKEHTAALLAEKADNVCRYIDHLTAMATFRKEQSKRLADLAEADFKRAEALQQYMLRVLTTLQPEAKSFSLPTHEIKSRRTKAVVVDDEAELPSEFLRRKTTYMPDKTAIKAAIQSGQEVPGAHLEERTSWSIK